MSTCIDGFVHPIPRDRLQDYKQLVVAIAGIWKEHGALDYWECVRSDLQMEGTRSFIDLVAAKEDEVVLFGWVIFESQESREIVHQKVAADPRVEELMATADTGFDVQRMVYGLFEPIVP